jgi:predicted transposase YbfD/YdcC
MIMISRVAMQIRTNDGQHEIKQKWKLAKKINWLLNNPIIIETKGIKWKQTVRSTFWNLKQIWHGTQFLQNKIEA